MDAKHANCACPRPISPEHQAVVERCRALPSPGPTCEGMATVQRICNGLAVVDPRVGNELVECFRGTLGEASFCDPKGPASGCVRRVLSKVAPLPFTAESCQATVNLCAKRPGREVALDAAACTGAQSALPEAWSMKLTACLDQSCGLVWCLEQLGTKP